MGLIDEKQARALLEDPMTVFVDTRNENDFNQSHVKGAVYLNPHEKESLFPLAQPLMPENARLILYCYGPECEMAEQVAAFLADLGYRKMLIMSAGFRAWEKAGYPVEARNRPG